MAGNLAEVVYANQGAKRNLPVNEHLMRAIQEGVTSVYGADYRVEIMSGAQGEGSNGTTGSRRHTTGTAGDLWIYAPDGKRLSGDDLIPLAQHWRGTNLGSVGFPSNNSNSLHLDLVGGKGPGSVPRQKGEGGLWYYGTPSQTQRSALTSGVLPKYAIRPSVVAQGLVPPGSLPTVGTLTDTVPARVAPVPRMPPARGNVPSNLIADNFSNISAAQYQRSLADMFGSPIGPTPHLTKDGRGVTDPAGIVFGNQMETNIWPSTAPAARAVPPMPTGVTQSYAGQDGIGSAAQRAASNLFSTQPRSDSVGSSPKWDDFARTFSPQTSIPGPNAPPKSAERLAAPSGVDPTKVFGAGPADYSPYNAGVVPFDAAFAPLPRPRPERPSPSAPATRTVTEMVANPEWDAWKKKTDEVGTMPTWDAFANTFAPKKIEPPRQISVTRQVPVTAPKVAPVPFSRPESFASQQPQRAPLRVTVSGANAIPYPQQRQESSNWAPQGYTNDGTGKITSNETGGVYYERHLRK